jgi:hypothetical protein
MLYFYGLVDAAPRFPFKTGHQQIVALSVTSLMGTLVSSWALVFGSKGQRIGSIILRTGLGIQISLTLYAVAGWRLPSTYITPSVFFSEFNWMTFIFEVAPATSIAACVLLLVARGSFLDRHGLKKETSA